MPKTRYAPDTRWATVRNETYEAFPTYLDSRISALSYTFTSGLKVLALSAGLSRDYRTLNQMRYFVKKASGLTGGVSSYDSYLKTTFLPFGLASEAEVETENCWEPAFALTKDGEKFRHVVDYSLKFFVDNEIDFHEIFSTVNRGSPKTCIDIIGFVAKAGDAGVRLTDIQQNIGISLNAVARRVTQMQKAGLLEFESMRRPNGPGEVSYILEKPIEDLIEIGSYELDRVRLGLWDVAGTIEQPKPFTVSDFAAASKYASRSAKTVVGHLLKSGTITQAKFNRFVRSSVKSTQKSFLLHYEWLPYVSEIFEREDFSPPPVKLERSYYESARKMFQKSSPYANRQSIEKRIEQFVACLQENPNITLRRAAEIMGMSLPNVHQIARASHRAGAVSCVQSEKDKRIYFWSAIGVVESAT